MSYIATPTSGMIVERQVGGLLVATVIGSTMGTHEEFAELVNHISSGELQPLLAQTYPLSQVRQAHEDFKAKSFFGKLALIPTE